MGMDSTAADYATAIIGLVKRPDRYHAMAAAAIESARENFTWERWESASWRSWNARVMKKR